MALARVYCGLAAADQSATPASTGSWLTVAVVDDAGRILDGCDLGDDATGYARLSGLLAERSTDPTSVAIATDSEDHLLSALLNAAGRPLACADDETADDYAERFADDAAPDEISAPQAERRAVGLARALQAGALSVVAMPTPRDLAGYKPVLAAHAALVQGRFAAASVLREVLRELYPAALRAYPDPAEPVSLAVLDALPEPGLLSGSGSARARDATASVAAITSRLSADGVADAETISAAITALRVAVAETPRRGPNKSWSDTVAATVRHAVAAVRSFDSAGEALLSKLHGRFAAVSTPVPAQRSRRTEFAARTTGVPTSGPSPTPVTSPGGRHGQQQPAAAAPAPEPPRSTPLRHTMPSVPVPVAPPVPLAPAAAHTPPPQGPPVTLPVRPGIRVPTPPPLRKPTTGAYPALPAIGPARTPVHAPPDQYGTPLPTRPVSPPMPDEAMPGRPVSPPRSGESMPGRPVSPPRSGEAMPGRPVSAPPPPPPGITPLLPHQRNGSHPLETGEPFRATATAAAINLARAERERARTDNGARSSVDGPAPAGIAAADVSIPVPATRPEPGSRTNWPLNGGADEWASGARAQDEPARRTNGGRVTPPWQATDLPPEPPALRLVDPVPPTHPTGRDRLDDFGAAPPLRLVDSDNGARHGPSRGPGEPDGTATPEGDRDLLIFAEARSAWFMGQTEEHPERDWSPSADQGWRAAEQAARPAVGAQTTAGLPRRVPQANLVPGSPVRGDERPLQIVRDAASIAAHTTGYFRGWRRGQEIGGYAVGGRPGRESAGGWDFSRDHEGRDEQPDYGYRSADRRS